MTVYIYALCDPRTGEIRYVGKTINIRIRFNSHCHDRVGSHKSHWIAQLRSDGLKPVVEVLEIIEDSDDTDWQDVERFWIAYLRFLGCRLTNLDSGGRRGKCASVETRNKLSAARKGRPMSPKLREVLMAVNLGRKMKPEWVEKMKASRGTFKHSLGSKLKIAFRNMGRRHSPESIEKIRASNIGKKRSSEDRETIRITTIAAHARKREALGLPPLTPEIHRQNAAAQQRKQRAKRKALGLPHR